MARGRLITDFERDCIRIGHSRGVSNTAISKFLGRTLPVIGLQIKAMREAGTLTDVPFDFVADEVAKAMRTHEVNR